MRYVALVLFAIVGLVVLTRVNGAEEASLQQLPTKKASEIPSELEASADIREAVDSVWAIPLMMQDGLNGRPLVYPEE